MAGPDPDSTVLEVPTPQQDETISEKKRLSTNEDTTVKEKKDGTADSPEITAAAPAYDDDSNPEKDVDEEKIIITGADAAVHLLPLRDDGDPALTFRSVVLATILSCFQAVMYQIYMVSGH